MKNIETSECEPYMVTLHLHSRINGSARKKKRLNKKIKPKYKPLKSHKSGKKQYYQDQSHMAEVMKLGKSFTGIFIPKNILGDLFENLQHLKLYL